MHYTLNTKLQRIDIMQDNTVIAFITAEYLNHYPYFQYLIDNQTF
jgi:hypothetical protein